VSDDLLARLDERVKAMQSELHNMHETLEIYVTRHEFWPVKVIALGLAGLILSAVVAAVIARVVN
jgi:hypothetical protein